MSAIIQMRAHPRLLNIVRAAINERARALQAPERIRLHAVSVAFTALREQRSTGCAIALGNSFLRSNARSDTTGPAPAAA